MNRAQWILIASFAASFYNVGTIWMTQFGWRLWTYVAPSDFERYHLAWWAMIKPVIFPVAAIAFFGSIAMLWWRPAGVSAAFMGELCTPDRDRRDDSGVLGAVAGADALCADAGWIDRSDVYVGHAHALDSRSDHHGKRAGSVLDDGGEYGEDGAGVVVVVIRTVRAAPQTSASTASPN